LRPAGVKRPLPGAGRLSHRCRHKESRRQPVSAPARAADQTPSVREARVARDREPTVRSKTESIVTLRPPSIRRYPPTPRVHGFRKRVMVTERPPHLPVRSSGAEWLPRSDPRQPGDGGPRRRCLRTSSPRELAICGRSDRRRHDHRNIGCRRNGPAWEPYSRTMGPGGWGMGGAAATPPQRVPVARSDDRPSAPGKAGSSVT
jgi:hypothetical protein